MGKHITPTEVCERLVGPIEELAAICRMHRKGAYQWRGASKLRDAGDILPKHMRALLAHSDAHGLGLTADHLIRGATEAEIDAILAARAAPQGVAA